MSILASGALSISSIASDAVVSGHIPDPRSIVFIPDPTVGPVERQFLMALQNFPGDKQIRNEYADWLIDEGRSEFVSECIRNGDLTPDGRAIGTHLPLSGSFSSGQIG